MELSLSFPPPNPTPQPSRIFNTWMGDPSKLLMLAAVVDVIKKNGLVDVARESGQYLLDGLKDLQVARNLIHKLTCRHSQTRWPIAALTEPYKDW